MSERSVRVVAPHRLRFGRIPVELVERVHRQTVLRTMEEERPYITHSPGRNAVHAAEADTTGLAPEGGAREVFDIAQGGLSRAREVDATVVMQPQMLFQAS